MILHGLPDDIGHFIESAVIHFFHGMENPTLHRFQAILEGRHGPFKYNIRCIVKKPVFILVGYARFVQ